MFSQFRSNLTPPTSVDEALSQALQILELAGIEGSAVHIEHKPEGGNGLSGAVLRFELPVDSLEAPLGKRVAAAGQEHGVPVQLNDLKIEQAGENRLRMFVHAESKVFGGTVRLDISGWMHVRERSAIQFEGLKMEGGTGIFGGVATALIRPRLAQLEAAPLDLSQLAGLPVEVPSLECAEGRLTFRLRFV